MNNVVDFLPYEVYEFYWGTAIKHRNGHWERIFLNPDGREIDVSHLDIVIHENGIEFL